MNTALPIMVIVGDRWSATCNITGGAIKKAIFSVTVECLQSPTSLSLNDITIEGVTDAPDTYTINCVKVISDQTKTSNSVVFHLPSELTARFKPGKYSYNISVVEAHEDNVQNDQIVTPIYTNAFNVFARVNAINPVQHNP